MPNIAREEVGTLTTRLSVTLSKEDYLPKLNAELNKYRKKAQLKGFRKGKTPLSLIKKMYGNPILGDVINDLLQKSVTDYLTDEDVVILGQPIPADKEQEEPMDFDVNNLRDYTFYFDIGEAPKFEVKGVGKDNTFERLAVQLPEESVDKELMSLRERVSKQVSVDTPIEEKDVLSLNAEELDGDAVRENGWACTFSISVDRMQEEVRQQVLSMKKGDKIPSFDIYQLENNTDETHVRKYLLQVDEADADKEIGNLFEAIIADVTRAMPADLDEEFFEKAFGGTTVTSEEEAREKIKTDLVGFYDKQAENIIYKEIRDHLMAENVLELPDEFLKRWLLFSNENMTDELIDKEYEGFAENLRWTLVRSKLVKQFEIEVQEEEILEGFKENVRQYFGGFDNELIVLNTANRLMADREQAD
ncbi:MAG: trigger factor, partial [Bacteroidota bacterium]